MISFQNIKKSFGPKEVLRGVSFDVEDGEVFFIIGASGVGKSVLIKHLIGLLQPDSGTILLDDEDITNFGEDQMQGVRKKCAMVFQHSTLFDSMTCAENVALPVLKHFDVTPREARQEADRLLETVQMSDFPELLPSRAGRRDAKARRNRPGAHAPAAICAVRRTDDQPGSGQRPPGRPIDPHAER